MFATRQRGQPGEVVHATRLKVLLATASDQRPALPRLAICTEAMSSL